MTGVVHSDRIRQRGGVRIEYIVAAVVSVALLVAMTAVLLSVSDRKATRELVRKPNSNAPDAQRSRPGETSSSATAKPTPSGTPEAPVAVTGTQQATPAATPDTPVVVMMTPSPAPAPAAASDTPVVVTPSQQATPAAAPDTPVVVVTMTPPTPVNTPNTPVVVTATPPPTPANSPDAPVAVAGTPQAAPATADTGAEIAADPLDTLKIGSRPQGNNWDFGFDGGAVSVQQSPQESSRCLRLLDTNPRATVWAMRKFPSQAQQAGFECRLRLGQVADGYALAILGGNKPAVLLLTRGGELGCEVGNGEWRPLQRYDANVWYTIRISADVKGKTFTVYVDGVQRGEKLKFRNAVASVDAWQVETSNKAIGTLYVTAMRVTEH